MSNFKATCQDLHELFHNWRKSNKTIKNKTLDSNQTPYQILSSTKTEETVHIDRNHHNSIPKS